MRQKEVGRKRNREAKCKKRRKNDKMDKLCKIQKGIFFFVSKKNFKIQKYSSFLFSFLQQKSFFFSQYCAITKCIHNVLYTLHGLVFASKNKILQKGLFNQCGKNIKGGLVRKQKSKSGKNVISGQKIFFVD